MAAGSFGLYLQSGTSEDTIAQSGPAIAPLERPTEPLAQLQDVSGGESGSRAPTKPVAEAVDEAPRGELPEPAVAAHEPTPSEVGDLPRVAAASRASRPKERTESDHTESDHTESGHTKAATPVTAPEPMAVSPIKRPSAAEQPVLVPAAAGASQAQRPSIGAAQGAVGVVLPAARACLAGQTQPSRVDVIFASDGRVRSVAVGGPAQGTPAEACIANAMRTARVRPFGDDTFTVRTTVRP
jgi:hypothetical protein